MHSAAHVSTAELDIKFQFRIWNLQSGFNLIRAVKFEQVGRCQNARGAAHRGDDHPRTAHHTPKRGWSSQTVPHAWWLAGVVFRVAPWRVCLIPPPPRDFIAAIRVSACIFFEIVCSLLTANSFIAACPGALATGTGIRAGPDVHHECGRLGACVHQ